jgi:dTDP-4-dehydrorhamnose 3,5-epimerase
MPLSLLEDTEVDGCKYLEFNDHVDPRGVFSESYHQSQFFDAGLPVIWRQDNLSISGENVLRGLHIQRHKPQGKLIRCFRGAIYDVCLDLRKDSDTFMKYAARKISQNKGLYLPPGTAHGFLALAPNTVVYYKCTSLYDAESDGGVDAYDPDLKIPWPAASLPMMSEKDKLLPSAREWLQLGEQNERKA